MHVAFTTLWRNHPATQSPPIIEPCANAAGTGNYPNECAILMSVCLTTSGVSLDSYKGTFCWFGHGHQHAIRAEQLGHWLDETADFVDRADIARRPPRRSIASQSYATRQGIVLFLRFRSNGNVWNHIDLWNGARMTYGSENDFQTAQQVWFWDVD